MGQREITVYGEGRSILITGASSGIGAALAVHLAGFGGQIALVARRRAKLEHVAAKVVERGALPLVLECDTRSPEAVAAAHDKLVSHHGPVDVAFLNAGVGGFSGLDGLRVRSIKHLFDVNVFGVLHWMELLMPSMLDRQQGIVAVTSSLAALRGLADGAPYAATKAAISCLIDGWRDEGRRAGVQLSVIEPGFIKSEMTENSKFHMPFLMETDDAAERIAYDVARGQHRVRFPWQLSTIMRVLSALPTSAFDQVSRRIR